MSVFLRAIDVLNERGWGKGRYEEPNNGPVCLVGACAIAAGNRCQRAITLKQNNLSIIYYKQ